MDGLSLGEIFQVLQFRASLVAEWAGGGSMTHERPATISYKTRLEDYAVVTLIKEADYPQP